MGFTVLCAGTDHAREARSKHKSDVEEGRVLNCGKHGWLALFDPWYDADAHGFKEEDPSPVRIFLRGSDNAACMGQWIDIYASPDIILKHGLLCQCLWEDVNASCLSEWDVYLQARYGDYL